VAASSCVSHSNAASRCEPHMSAEGCKPPQNAGRSGLPNTAQRMSGSSCTQGTPAGLPCGMPGRALVIDGAMQHAPHSLRQFMPTIILGANSIDGVHMTDTHAHPTDAAFQNGLAKRTQVMGQPFVDKAFAGASDFTLPMQHHITRAAWGDSWQRDALDLKPAASSRWPCSRRWAKRMSSKAMCVVR